MLTRRPALSGTAAAMAAMAFLIAAPALQAAAAPEQIAVWTPKELTFVYQSFTAKYSCDGLEDRVRSILRKLGVMYLQVHAYGCIQTGRPDAFPGVRIKMSVLRSAGQPSDPQAVPVHWQNVNLVEQNDPLNAAGDCELIEQVQQKLLPLFVTRNVQYAATCVPHQLTPGSTRLTAEVLVSDVKAPATAAK